jgi:hypothetical protein
MLRLSYILQQHGWAAASISNGNATIGMDVSYLSDALRDLARAARGILRGLPEATFSFQQEPGEHRFIVSREDDLVRITVYRFADTFSRARAGEPVMVAECSLHEFATECINCLRRVLDEHGEEGYRQRWKNADFPSREYRDLLALRRELSAARPTK